MDKRGLAEPQNRESSRSGRENDRDLPQLRRIENDRDVSAERSRTIEDIPQSVT